MTDFRATTDLGTTQDPTGDIETVEADDELLVQRMTVVARAIALDVRGDAFTEESLTELTGQLYDKLERFDDVETVNNVRVTNLGDETLTVTADIGVDTVDIPIRR